MNNKALFKKSPFVFLATGILLFFVIIISFFCNEANNPLPVTNLNDSNRVSQISWNVLFGEGSNKASRDTAIERIKDSIKKYFIQYNLNHGTDIKPKFAKPFVCICDTLLYNLDVKFVDGTSGSASTPPPPPTGPRGKGDLIDVKLITNNNTIVERNTIDTYDSITKFKQQLGNGTVDDSKILAVIDTGLDTTLFVHKIKDLLWSSTAESTFYNFLPDGKKDELKDDHYAKHGSGVTALALQAMTDPVKYPRIMILKALDKEKKGSVFSVSCALSYAIQHNATLVNASLGYTGSVDSVLHHYISLAGSHLPEPIKIFAAAGNTDEIHDPSKYCAIGTNNNLIQDSLFYPACFSKEMENVTSITGMSDEHTACFYQYFSQRYISLGVLNLRSSECCKYHVSFINKAYEGSSFATPVASGTMMKVIEEFGLNTQAMKDEWDRLIKHSLNPSQFVTVKGQYITYKGGQ